MRRRRLLGFTFLVVTALVGAGDPSRGKAHFEELCALCHGAQGRGDGVGAASLDPKPFDFTDAPQMAKLTDAFLKAAIKEGEYEGVEHGTKYGFTPLWMPAFPKLSDGEISDLIALERDMQKTKPVGDRLKEVTGRHASAYAVFQANCQRCHGEDLDGKGPDTQKVDKNGKPILQQPLPPNYRDDAFMGRFKDSALRKIIRNGREKVGAGSMISLMMPFGSDLNEQQLEDMVAYIRSLSPGKP